jgi:hypothetical protein
LSVGKLGHKQYLTKYYYAELNVIYAEWEKQQLGISEVIYCKQNLTHCSGFDNVKRNRIIKS